jgi:hypothetical protein
MVWVRFDDQYPIHRKVTRLSDAAFRLHTSAFFWCSRNLTDGYVPEEDLEDVCAQVRSPQRFVPELVKRGLWEPVEDGWKIHDYLEYQPSKEKVLDERRKSAERQKKFREQRKRPTERGSESNGSSNAVTNGRSNTTPSRPVPSSPEGTRTDTGSQSSSRRNARGNDDDSIDLAIVELIAERTGVEIGALWAAQVRQNILTGRNVRSGARMAYVIKAISERPHDFLPPADSQAGERPPIQAAPEWCGHCDPLDRRTELADGTVARCEMCHPLVRRTA